MGNVLSRVGIGSATVDTVLEADTVLPGASIDAHVEVEGGSTEQEVDQIYLALVTRYRDGKRFKTAALERRELTDGFTIEPGESRQFDVDPIEIPLAAPVTVSRTEVWVDTGLDIDWALDPTDEDPLEIRPGPYLEALLRAVDRLGFSLKDAKPVRGATFGPYKFAQEFEYAPSGGRYGSQFDEIELFPVRRRDHLDVAIELDRRAQAPGIAEETQHKFTVETTDAQMITDDLRALLKQKR